MNNEDLEAAKLLVQAFESGEDGGLHQIAEFLADYRKATVKENLTVQPAPDLALRKALVRLTRASETRENWKAQGITNALVEIECWDAMKDAQRALAATPQPKQPDERDAVIADLVEALDDMLLTCDAIQRNGGYGYEFTKASEDKANTALSRARAVSKTEGK